MDVQQQLTQKEHELAVARAKIRELEEAYRVQSQELMYWKNRASQLQNEVMGLHAQLDSARQQITRLRQQRNLLIGGLAAAAIILYATRD